MKTFWLSVIVPTLNEAKNIGAALDRLAEIGGDDDSEVIVVDGGSSDQTEEIARRREWVNLITSRPGRGVQLNRGAAAAGGNILLFLHADTRLPPGAGELIRRALRKEGMVGGCFQIKTVPAPEKGRLFRLLLKTADWRSRFSRFPYGDQAIFVKRDVFERLGGFRDYPIMEDLEFSRRLAAAGRIVRLQARVEVSARRWENNLLKNFLKLKILPLLYRLGVPPRRLARFYRDVR